MARLTFPDEGSRLVYRTTGSGAALASAAAGTAVVYSDLAGTVLADIQTTGGLAIPSSALTVDGSSLLPLFLGPDGVDTVYVRVNGGAAAPVYARADDRLDTLTAAVAANTAALAAVGPPVQYPNGSGLATVVSRPQLIDVRDYRAQFNGVHDDTTAIQAALNAAILGTAVGINDKVATIVEMPSGFAKVTSTLTVPANVWLRGCGSGNTYLSYSSATGPVVTQVANTVQQRLSNFGVIVNNTTADGIDLGNGGGASILGDGRVVVEDVVVVGGQFGFTAQGGNGNEMRLVNCATYRTASIGFYLRATDLFLEFCTAAAAGWSGFQIFGANSRIVGCKSFGSSAWGFEIAGSGRHEVTGCEAQDCAFGGFNISTGFKPTIVTGCIADSCGGSGFSVGSGAILTGCQSLNRGGAYTMGFAVIGPPGAGGGVTDVVVKAHTTDRSMTRLANNSGATAASYSKGTWEIDGSTTGVNAVAYAAAITPVIWDGSTIYVGSLTGNITINNPNTELYPYGQPLTLVLPQDATGGRTVTFGTAYATSGAVTTTASSVTTIRFLWDGTKWREITRSLT